MPEGSPGDGKLSEAATAAALLPPAPARPVLEFDIAAADIPRLLRSPALAARKSGRASSTPVRMVWHDTARGELAGEGLALCEQNGAWRLERLRPTTDVWLPATPSPVLAEAVAPELFRDALPAGPLVPVAAFTGRRRLVTLNNTDAPAQLEVLEGALRGVAQDEAAGRVMLTGRADHMAALAAELASQVRLDVPRAGLAASAMAVAHGAQPAARHLGTPAVPREATLSEAIAMVTGHLADVVLHWAPLAPAGIVPEPVHQMRVGVRRLRSALSVFKRAAPENEFSALAAELKDLAARLGAARDWDVFLDETGARVQQAFADDTRVSALMVAAARKRAAAYAALAEYLRATAWHSLTLRLALLPTVRPWTRHDLPELADRQAAPAAEYAAAALRRLHRHMLAAGENFAELPRPALHEVRKQGKRLRYASEFFAGLFPAKAMRRFVDRLTDVQEALGAVNDAAVCSHLMQSLEGGADRAFAVGAVCGYAAALTEPVAAQAAKAWRKFVEVPVAWD